MDELKLRRRSVTDRLTSPAAVSGAGVSPATGGSSVKREDAVQNTRISALLDEMRPGRHSTSQLPPRKAHTTNLVDLAQLVTARNGIYGSWQDRRPRVYGSQQDFSSSSTASLGLPRYDQLYCDTDGKSDSRHTLASTGLRRDPPEYGVLASRPISSWKLTASDSRPAQAGWLKNSRPLARGALSPAAYFMELENRNGANSPIANGLSVVSVSAGRVQMRAASVNGARNVPSYTSESSVLIQDSEENKPEETSPAEVLRRNSSRQASFMAAMQIHPLKDSAQIYQEPEKVQKEQKEQIKETPIRRSRDREDSMRRRQSSRSMGPDFNTLRSSSNSASDVLITTTATLTTNNDLTTTASSLPPATDSSSQDDDSDAMKMIRRARPKSYVLATSSSIQDEVSSSIINEQSSSTTSSYDLPSSLSGSKDQQHQSRAPTSSSASATSGGGQNTSRSLNAPHPPAAHRLQRFIALFNSNKTPTDDSQEPKKSSRTKREMKRSRTSLPTSRFSLPGTILQRDVIDRQTWVKHQEIALGKSGKRNHWEDRWAILCRRNLYLCIESPTGNSEKTVELAAHISIDVRNSIVDIAYDWLSSSFSKQRHVVRIVTQTRSEHLIELNTESEMLSWISVLQSSSEDDDVNEDDEARAASGVAGAEHSSQIMATLSSKLHNSQSIASLASSSCSTTTSELVSPYHHHNHNHHQQQQTSATNNNELLSAGGAGGAPVSQLTSSASFGGLSTATENAKNRLIMHRYIAKNSQLQSPTANKRIEVEVAATMDDSSPCTTCPTQLAGPSRGDAAENGEATTPKSGRKWKKSKAAKQGSGGGSSGSLLGSQGSSGGASGASVAPQQVLGVRLADCPVGSCEDHVPMLVQICVSVVETHGMDTVGIYRIPGNTAAVNALKESLSSRGFDNINPANVEALDPRWRDVNVVSSLLKMFLRKLPEPLLTDKLYPFFIDANRISAHHNRLHKLRNLLRKLPRPHYDTLRFLILHLAEITRHSDVNKMECRNLALMFGPSIVRPSDDNMATMVTHMSDQCKIIETLIHYNTWMFDETSTVEDAVPEQHPADGQNQLEPGGYGVGVPTGVSAASFNDMHNLIRKANEDQAAAMMNEGGKGQKIKNMLRRNSRRDKSKSKLKIESTAPAAVNPRGAWQKPTPSSTSGASVESAFCGNYQERDIDAEIESRQTISPQMTSGSADGVEVASSSTRLDQSPSLESSLGSLPDTSRTEPILGSSSSFAADEEVTKEAARRKRQEEMYSARRIFIAGTAAAAASTNADGEKAAIDALANHSQHLHLASSPALEVLSEETKEKIRLLQKQTWHDTKELRSSELLKTCSSTKDLTDALSCTSDYSTTSSAPPSTNPPLAVVCGGLNDQPNSSSDYASSDPSPCTRQSTSPASRPSNLVLSASNATTTTTTVQQQHQQAQPMNRSQKIRLRTKLGARDPARRHTLSDVDTLKEGRLDKLARWFGIRKSSPDVSRDGATHLEDGVSATATHLPKVVEAVSPPPAPPVVIVRTSPNELTPVSGDEQL